MELFADVGRLCATGVWLLLRPGRSHPVCVCGFMCETKSRCGSQSRRHRTIVRIMKLEIRGDTLKVQGIKELGAANSNAFRDWVRAAMPDGQTNIEIDLS